MDWEKTHYSKPETLKEIEQSLGEDPSLWDHVVLLSRWLSDLLDTSKKHASERNDSWEEEPYCKMCGKEGIEEQDFEEVGVESLVCKMCAKKL